jgi:hypothetical protein
LTERVVVKKNSRESIVISQTEFKGNDLVDIRIFFTNKDGELSPTKKGITIRLEKLDELVATLSAFSQAIEQEDVVDVNK